MRYRQLTLFDLDNTLLNGDTDYEWSRYLIRQGVLEAEQYEQSNDYFYTEYQNGRLDIQAFLEFQLKPLSLYSRAQLENWRQDFTCNRLLPMVNEKAKQLIAQHLLDKLTLCAIATATNSFITALLVRQLGFAHLIATVPEWDGHQFTGKARGEPAFQDGKVRRVEAWLEAMGECWGSFERVSFYSDSINDLPLLARVSHPCAVDPDPLLLAEARKNNWPVISLLD